MPVQHWKSLIILNKIVPKLSVNIDMTDPSCYDWFCKNDISENKMVFHICLFPSKVAK